MNSNSASHAATVAALARCITSPSFHIHSVRGNVAVASFRSRAA